MNSVITSQNEPLATAQNSARNFFLRYAQLATDEKKKAAAQLLLQSLSNSSTVTQLFVIINNPAQQEHLQTADLKNFNELRSAIQAYLNNLSDSKLSEVANEIHTTINGAGGVLANSQKQQAELVKNLKGAEEQQLLLTIVNFKSSYKPTDFPQDLSGLKRLSIDRNRIKNILKEKLSAFGNEVLSRLQKLLELDPVKGNELLAELLNDNKIPFCQILPVDFWAENLVGWDLTSERLQQLGKIDIFFIKYNLLSQIVKLELALKLVQPNHSELKSGKTQKNNLGDSSLHSLLEQTFDSIQNVLDTPLVIADYLANIFNRFGSEDSVAISANTGNTRQSSLGSVWDIWKSSSTQASTTSQQPRPNSMLGKQELNPNISTNIARLGASVANLAKQKKKSADDLPISQSSLTKRPS